MTLHDLRKVVKDHDTPLYAYSKKAMTDNVNKIFKHFEYPNFSLLFATMANTNPDVLSIWFSMGVGACVNSIQHLHLATSCGCSINKIQYTSTGTGMRQLLELLKTGVQINLDSISQLIEWGKLGGKSAGLRINSCSLSESILKEDRIGIEVHELSYAISIADQYNVSINGLHVYLGTNHTNSSKMLSALEKLMALAKKVPHLEYINIGGGVGIDYDHSGTEFDLSLFGKSVSTLISDLSRNISRDIKLIFEPGRSLAAKAGFLIVSINDIKSLLGKRYIGVDTSVSQFPRPLIHPDSSHLVYPLKEVDSKLEESYLVGPTTFSRDILAKSYLPVNLEIGDKLIICDAGAYCSSMASKFLGQEEPSSIII